MQPVVYGCSSCSHLQSVVNPTIESVTGIFTKTLLQIHSLVPNAYPAILDRYTPWRPLTVCVSMVLGFGGIDMNTIDGGHYREESIESLVSNRGGDHHSKLMLDIVKLCFGVSRCNRSRITFLWSTNPRTPP